VVVEPPPPSGGGVVGMTENDGWKSLPQVAKMAGIPESTVRRYVDTFKGFLKTRKVDNVILYHPETHEILQEIAGRYRQKLTTEQIFTELRVFRDDVIDMEARPLPQRTGGEMVLPLQQIAQTLSVIAIQREETLALIEKQRRQAEMIERLEKRISELEARGRRDDVLQGVLSWWKGLWKGETNDHKA